MKDEVTIIQSLRQHFNVRAIEWGMSGWALSWGLMVLLVPSIFTNPATGILFQGIARTVAWTGLNPSVLIGLSFTVLGLIRGVSLFINGLWTVTPLIRIATSAISAFLLTHVVVGLASGPPNVGTLTYFWLFLADCLSARRATEDWLQARKVKALYNITR